MIKQFNANKARLKRHQRLRNHVEGSQQRPRLNVFRSDVHIYAQVIDDATGKTIASASSLDEALRDFILAGKAAAERQAKAGEAQRAPGGVETEVAAQAAPSRGKGAKAEKAPAKGTAKGGQSQKGGKPAAQVKTLLPAAQKGERKTPVEALAAISTNRKVAIAREVGKLVAQRAKEKGVEQVVFDRGGYPYHGRVAALAEGAREIGLKF